MTKIGDLLGEQADRLVRYNLNVGEFICLFWIGTME